MPTIVYIGRFDVLWNEEGIARTLEALGCKVIRVNEISFSLPNFQILIKSTMPDYVMWAKLKIPSVLRPQVLQFLDSVNVKSICWVFDLYLGLARDWFVRQRDYMFRATHVFTTDGGHEAEFAKANINHHLLRQGILDEFNYLGESDRKEYPNDIVFVGCSNPEYPYRDKMIKLLAKRYGAQFKWYGRFGTNDIRGHDLNKLYASAKIVIGDSVYSPNYWSNRLYETIGRGGFYLHPRVPGIEKEFTPYEHFIPYDYHDFDGLFAKIDYYLTHDKERNKIRLAAFEHCKANYTFTKRCQHLLDVLRTSHN